MARIRSVKPDFFLDEDIAQLPFEQRLAFIGLWCLADKEGRLEDKPQKIKAMLFSSDFSSINKRVNIEKVLIALTEKPFIVRYEVDEKKYIQIVNFNEHQRPHHTEADSTYPAFNGVITVNSPLLDGDKKVGKEEGKGKEKGMEKEASSNSDFINSLKNNIAYRHINIDFELAKMDAWLQTPKGKRRQKTQSFIVAWLNRIEAPIVIPPKKDLRVDKPPLVYDPTERKKVSELINKTVKNMDKVIA